MKALRHFHFFFYLEKNVIFRPFVDNFLKTVGCLNCVQYVSSILEIMKSNFQNAQQANLPGDYFHSIRTKDKFDLFDLLSIDPTGIKNDINKQKDYIGQKERPLFKINDDEYFVLYFNYLCNSLFTGLVFSFYEKSGITKLYKSFPDFKTIIGTEYSEYILFRGLVKTCFAGKNVILKFAEKGDCAINPDCYYRKGNDIFLIEFKDNLLAAKAIQSGSFDAIKASIDEKFIQNSRKAKGISQISRLIQEMSNQDVPFDNIFLKQKRRNISVYPVIIHTNFYFQFPGINEYLNEEFQKKIEPFKKTFKTIKPLTLININFLYKNLLSFKKEELDISELINRYAKIINKKRKKATNSGSIDDYIDASISFDEISNGKIGYNAIYKDNKHLQEVYGCLDMPDYHS